MSDDESIYLPQPLPLTTQLLYNDLVHVLNNPYTACKDAHAIAVLTDWDEFINYDWQKIYNSMKKPAFVFDGRNILDAEKLRNIGWKVNAIGKA